jgi:PAS domain S-box-containing protein
LLTRLAGVSFRAKITIALVAVAVVPIVAAGSLLLAVETDTLKTTSRDLYLALAQSINAEVMNEVRAAVRLAEQTISVLNNTSLSESAALSILSDALASTDVQSAIGIYTVDGRLIDAIAAAHSPTSMPSRLPQSLLAGLSASKPLVLPPQRLSAASMPVVPIVGLSNGERFDGVVVTVVSNARLRHIMERVAVQAFGYERGDIYLTDDSLRIVVHTDSVFMRHLQQVSSSEASSQLGRGVFKSVQTLDRNLFANPIISSVEYTSTTGVPMLGAYSVIPALQMAIVVEQPQSVAYQSVIRMRSTMLAWGVGAVIVALVIAWVLGVQVSQPISQLVEASRSLASHDFSRRFTEQRFDEFGVLFDSFNNVADELARYNALNVNALIAERNKLRATTQQTVNPFCMTDHTGRITLANQAFARWLSTESAVLEGQMLNDVVQNHEHFQPLQEAFRQALGGEAKESIAVELRFQMAGEVRQTVLRGAVSRIVMELSAGDSNALPDASVQTSMLSQSSREALVAVSCGLYDISKEVEIDRMKTDLVRVVAHELRSPLTAIKGYSDILAMVIANEEHQRYALTISNEADRLNGIITKFLDISRIEAGGTEIQRLPLRLDELITAVVDINRTLAEEKGMTVELHLPPVSHPVVGDPDLIGQVILNFLSNAIKYSAPNKTVRITMTEGEEEFRVAVQDEGYGISESAQQRLFTKFFRATDDERVNNHVGTGLGLAFVKELVEQHGGKVGVESRINQGSTFWFTLPK